MKNILNLIIILISSIIGIFFFLIIDFIYSKNFRDIFNDKVEIPLMIDGEFYSLKRNFNGEYLWGSKFYQVKTDNFGFRMNHLKNINFDLKDTVFLGDSFTFGINGNWNETFVGMYENYTNENIINAGLWGYNTVTYLYIYEKLNKLNILKDNHKIFIGLDIGDPYGIIPDKIKKLKINNEKNKNIQLRSILRKNFTLTRQIYLFIKFNLFKHRIGDKNIYGSPAASITWKKWDELDKEYYFPYSVEQSLEETKRSLINLRKISKKNMNDLYLIIYPWPDQIKFVSKFDWEKWVKNLCIELECSGVINTFPKFKKYSKNNKDWYHDLYVDGDIHFNKLGNKMIFEEIIGNNY